LNPHRIIRQNSHLSTILGYAWPRGPAIGYQRERVETADNDFFHVDWIGRNESGPILLALHGLEGSSEAPYMRRLAGLAHQQGYRVAALNHRSCSGQDNRQVHCYHSAFTDDLQYFLDLLSNRERNTPIYAIGFSLGGSILANHLGRHEVVDNLQAACLCAAPFNLAPGAIALQQGFTQVYELRFLWSLKRKARIKAQKHAQGKMWIDKTLKTKTLEAFDHYWTAPSFGFKSSDDYYQQASSAPYLQNITIPTLAIHAQDDPIVVTECFPEAALKANKNIQLNIYPHGGHMGFWEEEDNWLSKQMLAFFEI